MRLIRDLRELKRNLSELRAVDATEEEQASFELAVSARHFSQTTKAAVDDKLSFSATLMRAGEVEAANRLIDELEEDVRTEEAALVEKMNEVEVARTVRREKITRLRLARVLVTAVLGAGLMAFSAMGFAVAGMFTERDMVSGNPVVTYAHKSGKGAGKVDHRGKRKDGKVKKVRIGSAIVALSPGQLQTYRDLRSGVADPAVLAQFLGTLPSEVVDTVRQVIASAAPAVEEVAAEVVENVPAATEQQKAKKKAAAKKTSKKADTEPQPEPEPEPTPTDDGGNGDEEDKGDTSGDPPTDLPF